MRFDDPRSVWLSRHPARVTGMSVSEDLTVIFWNAIARRVASV
jgi:hypothetical protein